MKITIYRGTKEIGGTLIELKSTHTRILIDAGYPLFLNGGPIDKDIEKLRPEKLIELGVLPGIKGLYSWDTKSFNAVIISHAHLDHYGLLKYIHPDIPVHLSAGTQKIIEISQKFKLIDYLNLQFNIFKMYKSFPLGDFKIKPFLMDHSAFDAAAFEISTEGKTVIYTGDFRGHGRKPKCLDRFIEQSAKQANLLLIEGSMLGRHTDKTQTEVQLEAEIQTEIKGLNAPLLFQTSSQNIDRLVSFFKVARKLGRTLVIDVYTANVLHELHLLGNNLPYPCANFPEIKVFFPRRLTQRIFNEIGEEYAKRFSSFHMSRPRLLAEQHKVIMLVPPSMLKDLEKCGLHDGVFIYSLWDGYRNTSYQQAFEQTLKNSGFELKAKHTSGHATVGDIKRVMNGLNPKKIVPIHTMQPNVFKGYSNKVEVQVDGVGFEI